MAINFPSSPTNGEEYTDANSGTWVYDSGTNSWTLTAGGTTSAFNFRGGHDFRSSTPPSSPINSGDMWIHDAPTGTIDSVYTGISGQIGNGQLVLWDGNSYVMVSGTVPGYPDVGDGEGNTLDSRYLKLGANAPAQTVQTTQLTTFNGRGEFGGGVACTGAAQNYFKGDSLVSINQSFDFNSSNNSGQLGTLIAAGGYLLNRFQDASPTSIGAQFKRLGNTPTDTATDAIATFIYGDYNDNTNVLVSNTLRMDGSGGVILEPTSDYRAKENIVDLPSAVDAIKALRPVNYNYTWAPGRTRPGFVAHELQETLPVAVTGAKDATEAIGTLTDADGVVTTDVPEPESMPYGETWVQTGTRPVYQGVDQIKLIPLLTKALQECLERIETLEAAAGY